MSERHAAYATLLHIVGGDRPGHAVRQGGKITLAGSTDLHLLLGKNEPHHRLHITPGFFRQARRPELDSYLCLLNLITEPEHNSKVLENMGKLLRNLPGKVVNRPEAVLRSTRDKVARQLAGIPGLYVPRVVRLKTAKPAAVRVAVERAGLQFPVILREAGTHTGNIIGLFDNLEDMQASLVEGGEHIATEFIDFRSPDGLYRKFRVFFFGKRRVFRHMLMSDYWNVHGKDRGRFMADRPDLIEEEKAMFATPDGAFPPAIRQILSAVRERIALDFFGMDFGMAPDGRVLLFEANATMNFFARLPGPQFLYLHRCLPPAQLAFRELLGLAPALPTASGFEADLESAG